MNKITKRRKRRRANSIVRFGKSSVRTHQHKSGRSGGIQSKKNHPKKAEYSSSHPNPPGPHNMDLGK